MKKNLEPILAIIFIFGSLVLLNILSKRLILRIDLTEDRVYTLSSSTKKLLSSLNDFLICKAYFSEKLPPNLIPLKTQVSDILEEYRIFSKGFFRYTFIDPGKDADLERKVARLGIPKLQMNILEKDKLQVVGGFLGMAIFYKDKKEIIPVVESTENLEYELTAKIVKMVKGEKLKCGVLYWTRDNKENYILIRDEIGKYYSVREVFENRIPEELNLLIVIGWKTPSLNFLYKLDQYIMKGGKVIFLVDPVFVGDDLRATPLKEKDLEFFKNVLNVKINSDLIKDASHESAPFASGYMQFIVPYPFWVKVIKRNFNRENPIVNRLESLVLPWVSSMEVIKDTTEKDKGISFLTLAQTTKKAWKVKQPFQLMPSMMMERPPDSLEQFPVALLLQGKFKSFFTDTVLPEDVDTTSFVKEGNETQVAIIPNTKFIDNRFLQMYPENLVFLLNLCDGIGFGEELIPIRSKGRTDRPVKEISDFKRALFKGFNTFGMAIVVAVFGISRYLIRQKRKRRE